MLTSSPREGNLTSRSIDPTAAVRRGYVRFDAPSSHPHNYHWPLAASDPVGEFCATRTRQQFVLRGREHSCAGTPLETLEWIWQEFPGYAIGWLSYEFALMLLGVRMLNGESATPLAHFFLYDTVSTTPPSLELSAKEIFTRPDSAGEPGETKRVRAAVTRAQYLRHVESIQRHIFEGDIYQANYTTRFLVPSKDHPASVHQRLLEISGAPFSAFLNFGEYAIVSSSPELLLTTDGRTAVTSPIKGTIAGDADPVCDARQAQKLFQSAKDRAELLMIVDLERNDLGKIAAIGSVRTDSYPRVEKRGAIHHLVQDISAQVSSGVTVARMLEALLPGGSISGVPKRRAVEILLDHEPVERGVYTGCIGFVHNRRAIFNLAIRTLSYSDGLYNLHAGGAITCASVPDDEYDEMRLKAAPLFAALGVDEGDIPT